jgi:SAM-dependent methyltransferase
MEPREYKTLFEFETFYWWYKGLHKVILDLLKQQGINGSARVLDAGCGTGLNMANLSATLSNRSTFGVDISANAVPYWRSRGLRQVCLGSVNHLPFRDGAFDAIVCVDVLESDAVVEKRAYEELWRVARANGLLIIVVPTYRWLLTKEHHRAVHASRRYDKNILLSLLQTRPIRLVRMSYMFTLLFPAIACYRLALRLFSNGGSDAPRSELRRLPSWVNETLYRVTSWERTLLRMSDLPFGSSLFAVVRKRIEG